MKDDNNRVTDPSFNPSNNVSVEAIKLALLDMEETIMIQCPEGRRRDLALTHLEIAGMFAVKSVFDQ